ncbi:MAG TPA: FAD-binding oxidoreductase, partial [Actinomycetota bacterium]|nr:FAD-binding oxidoreductase [Actinomycetota bacterium]
ALSVMTQDLPATADVVVAGGGVMGASTAYHLARMGAGRVVLVEREGYLGEMSTGQCAGGIRHQFSTETNVRLSKESIAMMERFPEELGQPLDIDLCGYLILLTDERDVAVFRENVALQRRLGVETEWLDPEQVHERIPLVNTDGVLAATYYDRDGLADPGGVVQGYATAARGLGVTIATGCEVTGIETASGRIRAVETTRGRIETPVVVNACGAWAPHLGAMVGVEIPIRPIRRQIVSTTPIPGLPPDFPFVVFFGTSLYLHREGEGILSGKSNNDEEPGFKLEVDEEWEAVHMMELMERFPAVEEAGIRARWAGLYEVTPDAHPIFGRVSPVEGFYVMAGFSGHGFMHGPVMGLLMAEEILEGEARTVPVGEFRYERFLTGDLSPEYNVI